MAGISRSSSVCIAYLMWKEKLGFDASFKQVKKARPCVYPNLGEARGGGLRSGSVCRSGGWWDRDHRLPAGRHIRHVSCSTDA